MHRPAPDDADPRGRLLELYRGYMARIYAYVASRVATRQDAEDIVSDIFLNVGRRLHQLRGEGDAVVGAWLFTIARNGIATHYRRNGQKRLLPLDTDDAALPDSAPHPESALANAEDSALIRRLIDDLPPRQAEIITLRFFGGLRNQEIASILKLDERTVAAHLSRGLKTLRERVHEIESAEVKPEGGDHHASHR